MIPVHKPVSEKTLAELLPSSWPKVRAKFLFKERKSLSLDGSEELLSASHITGITKRSDKDVGMFLAETNEGYKIVNTHDVVINTMWAWMGAMGVSFIDGIISPSYGIYYPITQKTYPKFFDYLLRSTPFVTDVNRRSKGVWSSRLRLYPGDFLDMLLPLPDISKQIEVADFLDRETARIDQLIEKKKLLIEKFQLREASFIEDCLTGRDVTSAKRQETNVPWLRTIPAHWKTMKLRHLVRISTGGRDTKDRVDNGDYPFFVRSMKIERIDSFSMNEEAVLTSGDGAGVGEVFHHVFGKFDLHQRMYAFTKFQEVSGDYFYYFLRAFFKLQMSQWSAKSTVDSVRMPFLKTMVFTIPPKEEQADIVERIKTQSEKYHKLVEKTESSIKLLQQFRISLITEAVTGQLDIQKWQQRGITDRRLDKIEEDMEQSKRASA